MQPPIELSEASFAGRLLAIIRAAYSIANLMAPIGDLLLRLWVARAFFVSGLAKIQSIDTTILLFQYEYMVPVLPPAVAAYLSIFGELCLPALLAIGLGGRIAAAGLFILNFVAVLSYPALMESGLMWHQAWGVVLLVLALRGPGTLSIDYLIARKFNWV